MSGGEIMPSKVPMRGVRVPDELFQKASFVAKENGRSFNQQCVFLLKCLVREYEAKYGPIPLQASCPSESTSTNTH
jgi:hypothetical protein